MILVKHRFYSFIHIALRRQFTSNHSLFFSEDSTIIPEHHSCCGYHGYDNRTQICTDNYKVINRSSRNNGSLSERQRVSRSICNTCHWRHRRSYREIKSGNQYVCKRHSRCYFLSINFNIYLEF